MKKITINLLIAVMALSSASTVFAEESGTRTSVMVKASTTLPKQLKNVIDQRKEALKEAREKMEEAREEKASTTRAVMTEMRERMQNLKDRVGSSTDARIMKVREQLAERFRKMLDRIKATIEREEKIMTRINSRIEKVKANGGDTTEAEGYTALAKSHLDDARAVLEALKLTADVGVQDVASTTGAMKKENLAKMKEVFKTVENDIREAHKALTNALGSLRGMSSVNVNASTTVTN